MSGRKTPREPSPPRVERRVSPRRWRGYISRIFGVDAARREAVVGGMLMSHASEGGHYWLQILLAMGIATLGLVLNSTAVVIGAMLISPLMSPIIELGMGLVVGSAFLTIRSLVRVFGSIAVVISCAAAITVALPFHEVTNEIAARTAPTLLDLLVAVLCALAAAFTTARSSSDGSSTAAGTAIGIALVPPLCVIGYGVGTGQAHVASGASLLFTANLSAIVLFAVLVFLTMEFETTPTQALEERVLSGERATHRMERTARRLREVFGVRYGAMLRVAMPLVLVIAVFLPLRRALSEVAWQVQVRTAIGQMLRESAVTRNAVRSYVGVERHVVDVRLVVVARPEEALALERDLRARITAVSSVDPTVEIIAVPDFTSLRQTVAALEQPVAPPTPRPVDFDDLRGRVARALADLWPREAHGPVLAWSLAFPPSGPPRIDVIHDGPSIDVATSALLSRAFETEHRLVLTLRSDARRVGRVEAPAGSGVTWIPSLLRALETVGMLPGRRACVITPPSELLAMSPGGEAAREVVLEALSRVPAGRATRYDGANWSVELLSGTCPEPPPLVLDAGADAAVDAAVDVPAARAPRRR
ncbi:MAG: DUF389 domain-containing protein [Polyangiales bacterium]